MIDTVKIYTQITKELYQKIEVCQTHKMSFNKGTGEIFYDITSDNLEGTYSTSLSVKVGNGAKYSFINSYCIEIEGSLHKIRKGQNAYDGYYNLCLVAQEMIRIVEKEYNIKLPRLKNWFLQRIDISKCFDLEQQEKVISYINSLKHLSYPRRNILTYRHTDLYVVGSSTTLKIYNKLKEFIAHDKSKLKDKFDINYHINKIQGFVRFECEIKKKKLVDLKYSYKTKECNRKQIKNNNIRLDRISYSDLEKIWSDEFMKLLKLPENVQKQQILSRREDVYNYLNENCTKRGQASRLYNFYLSLKLEGYDKVKTMFSKSIFYKNISELKDFGISWTNTEFDIIEVEKENVYYFNPFEMREVV